MGYSIHNSDVQEKQQPLQTSLPVPVNKSRHKYFTFQLLSKHMILKSIREHLELM
jgi:hypothetical protein